MSTPIKNFSCTKCSCKSSSAFAKMYNGSLQELSTQKKCMKLQKGELVFQEGSHPKGIFCVNRGAIKVFKSSSEGKHQIVYLAKEGDLLGYKEIISNEAYNVSAEALSEAVVCQVPRSHFIRMLHSEQAFSQEVMRRMSAGMGQMEVNLMEMAQKSVRERLAATLLMLQETYGLDGHPDSQALDIGLSREDLASMVGTATETVIRLLSEFKKENLIRAKGKKISIENPEGLQNKAGLLKTA